MDILKELNYLKTHYKMTLPEEYEKFVKDIQPNQYAGSTIKANGIEMELGYFLLVDEENIAEDIHGWYGLADEEREDYLTIAMNIWQEEIAIKVRGEDIGGIYYINLESGDGIVKLFDSFADFKKQLTSTKDN